MTIAEAYKEWCGTDRLVNSNKETHDSTECIEFAEYWHKKQVKNSVLADADVGESSCNCYADQWDKREDNTIYCTGCGKDV